MAKTLRPRKPKKAPVEETAVVKKELSSPRYTPDVLYAEDGSTFYPCKHCCRAFSNKPDLDKHDSVCSVGGRSTPCPFVKKPEKETETELNNNEEFAVPLRTSPRTRSGNRGSITIIAKRKSIRKSKSADKKRARASSPESTTNIITTGSASENINNLNEATKTAVLDHINKLLKNSSISVVAEKDSPIIVRTVGSETQPPVEITSRNLNENCVEIKTVKAKGEKHPTDRLPDISEILESNFGITKPNIPHNRHDANEECEIDDDLKSLPNTYPQSLVTDSEMSEIILDDVEFEGTIILEDLDIHICKQCGSVYHSLEDLVHHDKYEHRKMKKRYPPSELEKFDLIFKARKSTKCPICAKELSSKNAWPRHLQTHSDVLNYECQICRKKFTRNDHRKLHEKRHFGIKGEQ